MSREPLTFDPAVHRLLGHSEVSGNLPHIDPTLFRSHVSLDARDFLYERKRRYKKVYESLQRTANPIHATF